VKHTVSLVSQNWIKTRSSWMYTLKNLETKPNHLCSYQSMTLKARIQGIHSLKPKSFGGRYKTLNKIIISRSSLDLQMMILSVIRNKDNTVVWLSQVIYGSSPDLLPQLGLGRPNSNQWPKVGLFSKAFISKIGFRKIWQPCRLLCGGGILEFTRRVNQSQQLGE
jgi:hypothetical protein